jgi:hypothetical protein
LVKKRQSGRRRGNSSFDHREGKKALKRKAQERWELKEASKEWRRLETVERVAKPYGRHF